MFSNSNLNVQANIIKTQFTSRSSVNFWHPMILQLNTTINENQVLSIGTKNKPCLYDTLQSRTVIIREARLTNQKKLCLPRCDKKQLVGNAINLYKEKV